MANRGIIDTTKEQKANFYMYLKTKFQEIFTDEIYEKGEEKAKIDLILNKDLIIVDNILYEIRQLAKKNSSIYLSFKYYYENENIENIVYYMNEIFLTEYNNIFKSYKIKQKAQKEYYKTLIYNEIIKDIEEQQEKYSLSHILDTIKGNYYKKLLLEDLKEKVDEFNEDIFNDLYIKVVNKIVSEYKRDADLQDKQQNNGINIPLGWKVYGITEIIGKIFKI